MSAWAEILSFTVLRTDQGRAVSYPSWEEVATRIRMLSPLGPTAAQRALLAWRIREENGWKTFHVQNSRLWTACTAEETVVQLQQRAAGEPRRCVCCDNLPLVLVTFPVPADRIEDRDCFDPESLQEIFFDSDETREASPIAYVRIVKLAEDQFVGREDWDWQEPQPNGTGGGCRIRTGA